jgi:deazaflavin-dependent oxidoreductase (nitroreductase family)
MPNNFGNIFVKALINSPFHFLLGPNIALISVAGRKSGKPISTPINVTRDGILYIATSTRERSWWRNLCEGASAQLRVAGQTIRVHGEVMESTDEVTEGLRRYFHQNPQLARYFNVRLDPDQKPIESDLQRAATIRVVIRLQPMP